jgi:hypothetical protein
MKRLGSVAGEEMRVDLFTKFKRQAEPERRILSTK